MTVAVMADLVAALAYFGDCVREGIGGVTGYEPGGFDIVAIQQIKDTPGTDHAKLAPRNHAG
jgi:hypothetical protein